MRRKPKISERDVLVDSLLDRLENLERQVRVLSTTQLSIHPSTGEGESDDDPARVPVGGIILWDKAWIPNGYQICDGTNGTKDLRDLFVAGAGGSYALGDTGGVDENDLRHKHGPGTLNTDTDTHNHGAGSYATDTDEHNHTISQAWTRNTNNEGSDAVLTTFTLTSDGHAHDVTGASANDSHDHDVNSGETASAGSAAQENRPPFYALYFIQRMW